MLSYLYRGNVTMIVVGGGQFKGSSGGAGAGGCHESHDSRNKKNDLHEDNDNGFSEGLAKIMTVSLQEAISKKRSSVGSKL